MPLVGNGGGSAGEAGDAEETAFLLQADLDSPGPHAAAAAAQQNPGGSNEESRKVEADFPGATTLPTAEMPMLAEGEAEKAFFDVSNSQVKSGAQFKSGSSSYVMILMNDELMMIVVS